MSIRNEINACAPLPWDTFRISGRFWTKVVDADGIAVGEGYDRAGVLESDGILLAVVHQMAPDFADYVEQQALRGGSSAQALIDRFRAKVKKLREGP